jgi:hypothetical protein
MDPPRIDMSRKATDGVQTAHEEETQMSQNQFPNGWDENRVRKVAGHYDERSQEHALAEDEAGVNPFETVMSVPHDLVSQVRELIAKHSG